MNGKTFLAAALLALLPLPAAAAQTAPLQVVVSILPQQYFVERIAGSRVEVLTLVQPGDNEATYSPGPATLAALDGARVWFTLGVHFENAWLGRITRDRPGMEVVPLAAGLPLRRTEESIVVSDASRDHDHDHSHAGMPDPHTWTDPRLAALMVERIAAALARLDPAGADEYRARSLELQAELLALHAEIATRLAPVSGRAFIVFHPSWGYFADAYGLVQLPIEVGGREPGPRSLAEVIRRGREAGVRAVFVQQQFSQRSAQAVAQALGAEVVEADPLALDYIDNLRAVAVRMAAALATPPGNTP
jgi:zinc transport system substrate-binding protein